MFTPPTKEHLWLARLVGEWTYESECDMGPGQPKHIVRGRETVRMIGDLWLMLEGQGEMPGAGTMTAVMTVGFDPARDKFVGSWIGSPAAFMFVYEGALDAAGKVLTLDTMGPSFTDSTKQVRYQDVIEIKDDATRLLWSQTPGDDGKWVRFMSATFKRVR